MRPLAVFAPLELDAGYPASQRGGDDHPVYAEPGRGTLRWELRKNLLVEPPQLIYLVLYGPQKDLLDPRSLELEEFFGALGSCSNGQSLAQQFDWAIQCRAQCLNEEFFGQAPVLRYIVEHRAQCVWEARFLPSHLLQRLVQSSQGVCKRRCSDVIGRSEPAISQASDPVQSRLRLRAANPDRYARLLSRKGGERCRGFCIELASERRGISLQETTQ
jgi:hypothetical protein